MRPCHVETGVLTNVDHLRNWIVAQSHTCVYHLIKDLIEKCSILLICDEILEEGLTGEKEKEDEGHQDGGAEGTRRLWRTEAAVTVGCVGHKGRMTLGMAVQWGEERRAEAGKGDVGDS